MIERTKANLRSIFIACNNTGTDDLPPPIDSLTEKDVEVKYYLFNSSRVFMIDKRERYRNIDAIVYNNEVEGEVFCRYIRPSRVLEQKGKRFDQSSGFIKKIKAKEST
jgi:hypothetical protein